MIKRIEQKNLSIIIPACNEEGNIAVLKDCIFDVLNNIPSVTYEIIFIDDGSIDKTWDVIEQLHEKDKNVLGIKFSRNFGHDLAIKCGIDSCNSNVIICMDGDLQHPPELIPEIYESITKEKNDIVLLKRIVNENSNLFRKITNKFYYWLFRKFTKIDIAPGISDFWGASYKVINVLKKFQENSYFNRGALLTIGFKNKVIEYQAKKRLSGESKYNTKALINLSIKSLVNFTIMPLKIVVYFGLMFSLISFLYGMYSIIKTFLVGSIAGWPSIIAIVSFLNGFIILLLSIFFDYFIVLFNEIKKRPVYIIEETLNEQS